MKKHPITVHKNGVSVRGKNRRYSFIMTGENEYTLETVFYESTNGKFSRENIFINELKTTKEGLRLFKQLFEVFSEYKEAFTYKNIAE